MRFLPQESLSLLQEELILLRQKDFRNVRCECFDSNLQIEAGKSTQDGINK